MATSGSFKWQLGSFTGASGTPPYTPYIIPYGVEITWERTSYSLDINSISTINWTVKPYGSSSNLLTVRQTITLYISEEVVGADDMTFGASLSGGFSGTTGVRHAKDGTAALVMRVTTGEGNEHTETFTLDRLNLLPYIISAPNFNDEENPTITYSSVNSKSFTTLNLHILDMDDKLLVASSIPLYVGENLTHKASLTATDRAELRKAVKTGSSIQVKFLLRINVNGTFYDSDPLIRTLTLINHLPEINPVILETNERALELTGDPRKFIRYFGDAWFSFEETTKKYATVNSRYVVCGSTSLDDYPSEAGTIHNIDSNTFYFGLTDSRGNTVRQAKVVDLVPYVKLTAALTLQPLSLSGDLDFSIDGNYFNGSFGAKDNSIQFEYLLKKDDVVVVPQSDGSWGEPGGEQSGWTIIEPSVTFNDNKYKASYNLSGLDPNSTYTLTINVIDELTTIQTTVESIISTPIFDWSRTDFRHNTPVYLNRNMSLRTVDNYGYDISVLNPCDTNGDLVLGLGQQNTGHGNTRVSGDSVELLANKDVYINGRLIVNGKAYASNQVLWEGVSHMNGGQTAQLTQKISDQPNGIVLVFSLFRNNTEEDVSIQSFFISKKEVELLPNAPHTFFMMINSGFSAIGAKYLSIANQTITGNATNTLSGTNSGITFDNSMFVLRYVIGV